MAFELNAYLARIHFTGGYAPDLNTLRQLHLLHTCAIPFENLGVLLERKILLDDSSVFEKQELADAAAFNLLPEQNITLTTFINIKENTRAAYHR